MATLTLAPNSTWFSPSSTSIKRANITQINIVDSYTPTGSETASWDASADKDGSVKAYVIGTVLTLASNGSGKIYANSDSSYAFSDTNKKDYFSNLTTIEGCNLLDTSNATTLAQMFRLCMSLTTLDVSGWDTKNVTSLLGVFVSCVSLKTVDVSKWDVGNVQNMQGVFMANSTEPDMTITSVGDLSGWNVSNVTTMNQMFSRCRDLTSVGDLSGWNVGKVTNMKNMFSKCTSLSELDLRQWDVSNVTTLSGVFQSCISLRSLDLSDWDTSSCTDMSYMFNSTSDYGDMKLTTIGKISSWDVSKVTTMKQMFQRCAFLESLDLSDWDTSSCTDMSYMFAMLNNLKKITIGVGFSFRGGGITDTTKIAVLPTPSSANIPGADGIWYDIDKTPYVPADVPSNTFETYYASTGVVDAEENELVFVKQGSLIRAARAIRAKNGLSEQYQPAEFANAILAIGS